ncbi:MAG: hypothetical protein NT069_04590, partial [Planctomycetota bacterium]|nr:hypothetical protein [Planctomycetota bacterium]
MVLAFVAIDGEEAKPGGGGSLKWRLLDACRDDAPVASRPTAQAAASYHAPQERSAKSRARSKREPITAYYVRGSVSMSDATPFEDRPIREVCVAIASSATGVSDTAFQSVSTRLCRR